MKSKNEVNNMTQISKKDWKLYREKLPQWQERYMEGLIQEYIDFLRDEDIQASTKFWELRELFVISQNVHDMISLVSKY